MYDPGSKGRLQCSGRGFGIRCCTDRPDYGDPLRARGEDLRKIRLADAADTEAREAHLLAHGPDQLEADAAVLRLGGRGENRPDPDIIRPLLLCGQRLLQAVGGFANEPPRPEQLPGRLHREVLLPQMHAVRAHRAGDIRPVIDEERDASRPGHSQQPAGGLQ